MWATAASGVCYYAPNICSLGSTAAQLLKINPLEIAL